MPIGDFPTVFPTIMTCRLNRMVTSKNGNIHRRYCIFLIFCQFLLIMFVLLIVRIFFGEYLHILHIYLQYDIAFFLHMMTWFIVHGKICLQFTCIFCIFAVHGRHGTVENASRIL